MVLVCEQHPDIPGEALQEQDGKQNVVVLISWAQLLHVGEELQRPLSGSTACRSSTLWKSFS